MTTTTIFGTDVPNTEYETLVDEFVDEFEDMEHAELKEELRELIPHYEEELPDDQQTDIRRLFADFVEEHHRRHHN